MKCNLYNRYKKITSRKMTKEEKIKAYHIIKKEILKPLAGSKMKNELSESIDKFMFD